MEEERYQLSTVSFQLAGGRRAGQDIVRTRGRHGVQGSGFPAREYKVKVTDLDMSTASFKCQASRCNTLGFLKPHQVSMIDDALCSLGEFGEVRLVVEKGKLRFLVMQRSYDVMKLGSQTLKRGPLRRAASKPMGAECGGLGLSMGALSRTLYSICTGSTTSGRILTLPWRSNEAPRSQFP